MYPGYAYLFFFFFLPSTGEGGDADGGAEEQTGAGAGAGAVDGDKDEEGPSRPSMTPEQVEEFFRSTMERLTSPEEREDIKSKVDMFCRTSKWSYFYVCSGARVCSSRNTQHKSEELVFETKDECWRRVS